MKKRLDVLLCERKLSESREKARALIMSGIVYVDGEKIDKCGEAIGETAAIELRGNPLKYVSRGGLKLEKAIDAFGINLGSKICMDVGASTGGFTDCMLQNGASKVYSVDVGYGQLAWKLRGDSRVVTLERTNIRNVTPEIIPEKLDFVSIDVSFISLSLVLPIVHRLVRENGRIVCLIKPQFEAGRENVGKNGVVRDKKVHSEVIEKIFTLAENQEFAVLGLDFSPVKGPKGNIEYLIFLEKSGEKSCVPREKINEIVEESHQNLNIRRISSEIGI